MPSVFQIRHSLKNAISASVAIKQRFHSQASTLSVNFSFLEDHQNALGYSSSYAKMNSEEFPTTTEQQNIREGKGTFKNSDARSSTAYRGENLELERISKQSCRSSAENVRRKVFTQRHFHKRYPDMFVAEDDWGVFSCLFNPVIAKQNRKSFSAEGLSC